MVVIVHIYDHGIKYFPSYFRYTDNVLRAGHAGVQLFFLVSGFAIYSTFFARKETERYPKLAFFTRRAFRILPLWWLVVAFAGYYYNASETTILSTHLLYFGFFRYQSIYELKNVPGWSLFIEESFYLIFPFIALFLREIKGILQTLVIALVVSFIWRWYGSFHYTDWTQHFIDQFPLAQWFLFPLGMLLFHLIEKNNTWIKGRSEILLTIAGIFATYFLISTRNIYQNAFALSILFILGSQPNNFLGRICRSHFFIVWGKCCYSTYLIQLILFDALHPLTQRAISFLKIQSAPVEIKLLLFGPFYMATLLFLSVILYKLVERPSIALGNALISTWQK
jgi:peptidoglycan/LPS O-acetylase OafA/YrhL